MFYPPKHVRCREATKSLGRRYDKLTKHSVRASYCCAASPLPSLQEPDNIYETDSQLGFTFDPRRHVCGNGVPSETLG